MDRKIIITVLSTIKKAKEGEKPNIITYESDLADVIKTEWTNAAGLTYLLKTTPDCTDVICMCSDEVNNDEHKNKIRDTARECGCENINLCFIEYQTDAPVMDITSRLINQFSFKSSDIVYIDTTGGFRSIVYALVYIFRYFEYMNIRIEKAIYSSFPKKKGEPGKIEDIKNTFRMFDLINGTHEFTSSGNPQTLIEFFKNSSNPKITSLLSYMTDFYDAISLCRLNNISSTVKKLNRTMNDLQHDAPKNLDEALFINLIPTIKSKFFTSGKFTYLSLTKWCLANNLLQQAVTIYVEKMPRAYFKELNFLSISEDVLEQKSHNPGTDVYVEYFMASTLDVNEDEHLSEIDRMVDDNLLFIKFYSANRNYKKLFKDADYSKESIDTFKTIVEIRDTFYDENGVRLKYTQNDKRKNELLAKLNIKELNKLPGDVNALLKLLKNTRYSFKSNDALNSSKKAEDKNSKSIINNYNRAINGDLSSEINRIVDQEVLRKLRLDYLYIKYIRNQINHASEVTDNEPLFKTLMSNNYQYKFPENNNFSASDIRDFLHSSVQFIDRVKEKL